MEEEGRRRGGGVDYYSLFDCAACSSLRGYRGVRLGVFRHKHQLQLKACV